MTDEAQFGSAADSRVRNPQGRLRRPRAGGLDAGLARPSRSGEAVATFGLQQFSADPQAEVEREAAHRQFGFRHPADRSRQRLEFAAIQEIGEFAFQFDQRFDLRDQLLELIFERRGRGQALERFDLAFDVGDAVTDERGGFVSGARGLQPLARQLLEFLQLRDVRFAVRPADLVGVVRPFGPVRPAPARDRFAALARVRLAADLRPEFPGQRFQPASRWRRPGRSPLRVRATLPVSSASANFSSSCWVRSSPPTTRITSASSADAGRSARIPLTSVSTLGTAPRISSAASSRTFAFVSPPSTSPSNSLSREAFASWSTLQIASACETHSVWDSRASSPSPVEELEPPPHPATSTATAKAPTSDDSNRIRISPTLAFPISFVSRPRSLWTRPTPDARRPRSGRFGVVVQRHRCLATPMRGYAGRRLEARRADSGRSSRRPPRRGVKTLRKSVIGLPDGVAGRPGSR